MIDLFKRRSSSMYASLKKRGRTVRFSLASFRDLLESQVNKDPHCPYCKNLLMLKNVSADHIIPISRCGQSLLSNIQFICKACNRAKGDFTHEEFAYLLALLDRMEKKFKDFPVRRRVVSALRISNSFRQGQKWRTKKEANQQ